MIIKEKRNAVTKIDHTNNGIWCNFINEILSFEK